MTSTLEAQIAEAKAFHQAQRDNIQKAVEVERLHLPESAKQELRTMLLQVEKITKAVHTGAVEELFNEQTLRSVG